MASGGFSVTITAADRATAVIDRLNKRIAGLTAPARQFGRSVERLGEVSGVNRLAEGMQQLGGRSLDVFRSMERLVPSMGALTGAASIAGIAALTQRFAQLGQSTLITGQRLGTPVQELTAFRGAARLAGASAEQLDAGFGSLYQTVHDAAYRHDPAASGLFSQLGIQFADASGKARETGAVFIDIASKVQQELAKGNADGARRIAERFGLTDLLPLLSKGGEGIKKLQADVAKLGGVIDPEMAKRADEAATSFGRVEIALGGVATRLGDNWAALAKPYADAVSNWIATNPAEADRIAKVASAIGATAAALGALALLKAPAGWVLRVLGLGAFANPIVPAAIATGVGAYDIYKHPFGNVATQEQEDAITGHAATERAPLPGGGFKGWWSRNMPGWVGGGGNAGAAVPAQAPKPPVSGSLAAAEAERSRAFWRGLGYTPAQTAGWLAQEAAESGFVANKWNRDHTSYGLFQMTGTRLAALQGQYGQEATADEQRAFVRHELETTERHAALMVAKTDDPVQAGREATGFERPAGLYQRAEERGRAAQLFYRPDPAPADAAPAAARVEGRVQVDVKIAGAGRGSSVKVMSEGHAHAAPPRLEQPMPGAGAGY